MIAGVVDELIDGPIDRTFVVVSEAGGEIRGALRHRPVEFVVNRARHADMLSSVRCGLRALPDDCAWILVVLGDQPGVRRELVERMVAASRKARGGIVVPTWRGRRGHPLLFAACFKEEVLSRFDGTGLRGLLRRHARRVLELPAGSSAVIEDIDTPADYDRLIGAGGPGSAIPAGP